MVGRDPYPPASVPITVVIILKNVVTEDATSAHVGVDAAVSVA